jgi:hypothetical protein
MPPTMDNTPVPPQFPSNQDVDAYYEHLKDIYKGEGGMGTVSKQDMVVLDRIFAGLAQRPTMYDWKKLNDLFTLIEQLGSLGAFEKKEIQDHYLTEIRIYREELGIGPE